MKAVILCAGMGRRTGLSYPKCLYKIDKKISLLNLNIKKIKKLGFKNSEIILVTGFKEKLIKKETKNLFTYITLKEVIPFVMLWEKTQSNSIFHQY